MSRNERRGAIAVLALIAAVLVATCAVRCSREQVPPVPTTVDIRQFEAEVDSSAIRHSGPKHKKPAAPKKKRHPATSKPRKPSKPAPAPRRLDPVPQI